MVILSDLCKVNDGLGKEVSQMLGVAHTPSSFNRSSTILATVRPWAEADIIEEKPRRQKRRRRERREEEERREGGKKTRKEREENEKEK